MDERENWWYTIILNTAYKPNTLRKYYLKHLNYVMYGQWQWLNKQYDWRIESFKKLKKKNKQTVSRYSEKHIIEAYLVIVGSFSHLLGTIFRKTACNKTMAFPSINPRENRATSHMVALSPLLAKKKTLGQRAYVGFAAMRLFIYLFLYIL
jgi:hypothetical protein